MTQLRLTFALGVLLSAGAFAQEPHQGPGQIGFSFQGGDFVYLRTEGGMENKIVKNSPYSAQSVSEFTQTLADGNRIHRTSSGSIARDSEGRTRREQAMTAIGQMSGSAETMKSVMIHDPVGGTTYSLEPHAHTAHVSHNTTFNVRAAVESMVKEKMSAEAMAKMKVRSRVPEPNTKSEELGLQVMEGVSVQGKRVTRTIPAGEIGNDRALEIVTETWFSPELQVVVMSRTTDPRSGDSVYKLTNVSRAEPDRSLFEVPADYQVREEGRGGAGVNVMRRAPRPEE
ncbi:MAG TPA: hypothetical protein VIX89_18250 [Bryobacteraceae bacterium]